MLQRRVLKLLEVRRWRGLVLAVVLTALCGSVGAQDRVELLRAQYQQATDDSLKINLGIQLSRQIHRGPHEEEDDYAYAQEVIEKALSSGDSLLYAQSLDNQGLLYRYHQRYGEAFP